MLVVSKMKNSGKIISLFVSAGLVLQSTVLASAASQTSADIPVRQELPANPSSEVNSNENQVDDPARFDNDKQMEATRDTVDLDHPFVNPVAEEKRLLAERIGFESQSDGVSQVNLLSTKILQKEIELLKINTRYRMMSTRGSKYKPWRLFAYSLAGNVVSEVGISHVAYARWKYWRRPALATKPFLRKGPLCLLIGHSIIVGGVLIESLLDARNDYKLHKSGFDRKTCRQRVIALQKDIEELSSSRDVAIRNADLTPKQSEAFQAEGRVLADVKDCAVSEFSKFAIRDVKFKTARNTANLVTLAGATTGGYMGALGNLLAVTNRKPRIALPAGVGFVLSGSFIALTPLTTKLASILAANAAKNTESKLLGLNPKCLSNFDADRSALGSFVANQDGLDGIKSRLQVYNMQKDIFDKQALMAKAEARANNKEFVEKLISNAIVGGTKIGWGTQLIVAGSAWSNTAPAKVPTLPVRLGNKIYRVPIRPMKTPAQLFSRRVAQGATTFIPGPAVGALDALQSRVRGEIRERKAKSNGTSAGQMLAARLKILDDMDAKLK